MMTTITVALRSPSRSTGNILLTAFFISLQLLTICFLPRNENHLPTDHIRADYPLFKIFFGFHKLGSKSSIIYKVLLDSAHVSSTIGLMFYPVSPARRHRRETLNSGQPWNSYWSCSSTPEAAGAMHCCRAHHASPTSYKGDSTHQDRSVAEVTTFLCRA